MFKRIDDDEAVIVENGVFRPAEVYERDGLLFVKAKGGFVRVKADGSTSHPNVRVETLAREGPLYKDAFGRLAVSMADGRKPVMLTHSGETMQIEDKRDANDA